MGQQAPAGKARGALNFLLKTALIFVVAGLCLGLALTDPTPLTATRPAPSAEQVGAARDAVTQLAGDAGAPAGISTLRLDPEHLDGLSALASHGFRPDRVNLFVSGAVLHVQASRKLPLGRWLNVTAKASGSHKGFPSLRMQIGSVPLSPFFSRLLLGTARSGLRVTGADIPPLGDLVREFEVEGQRVAVTVNLPDKVGVLDKLLRTQNTASADLVVKAYCELAEAQRADPQGDLATQVRRAFPLERAAFATTQSNAAAFVALAMAIVDKSAGSLAGVGASDVAACPMPASRITLHGREDLSKHWALSAALAVGPGTQIAGAMGEWKELADSLGRQSRFQPGEPSGFSFVDIAADRSGFRIADAAGQQASAKGVALRLATATQEEILPPSLLSLGEGPSVDFVKNYGSLDDPRFAQAVKDIDLVLDQKGLLRP
jgi:hypothetical protein